MASLCLLNSSAPVALLNPIGLIGLANSSGPIGLLNYGALPFVLNSSAPICFGEFQ